MFEPRNVALAVIAGLAILSAVAVPGFLLTTGNASAQVQPSNETTTDTPQGNETSSSTPTITLTPSSGAAGSNVTIAGSGFSPSQTFKFTFDGGYILTGNMVQFATGEFNTTALVPKNATSGDHEVKAAGSSGENSTATFTVGENNTTSGAAGNVTSTGNETSMTSPSGNETSVGPDSNSTSIAPPSVNNTATPIQPES